MKNVFLTLALASAMLVGGMAWTNTAEARPRAWRYYGGPGYGGPVYGGPAGYYGGYYSNFYPRYYSRYYAPRFYSGYYAPQYYYSSGFYSYPYRYSYGPGIYFRY